jgi:tetratricopeptide (TPR) repeat protein
MILYRPIGLQELELIYDGGMKAFPARLPKQPIFYPVLNLEYARQTAAKWNAKSGQLGGYVTQFKVEDEYIARFEKHTVGKSKYQEYWIPADDVEEFNKHLIGHIKVVEAHFGDTFQGFVPDKFGLQGKDAVAQFTHLANSFVYNRMDFYLEVKRNHKAVFLNYPFWLIHESKNQGLKEKVLQGIKEAWLTSFPKIPLPNPVQEENTPSEQADPVPPENTAAEEAPPVKLTQPRPSANRVQEDTPPDRKPASRSPEPPVPEDPPRVRPIKPFPFATSPPRNTSSVKPSASHSLANPVRENTALSKPTVSHFSQGVEFGLSGKYHEAVDELSKSVKGNPNIAVAHTSLGVAFHRLGEDDRAISCYEAALRIDSNYAEAYYFRANIFHGQGKVREAITEYTKAIGLKPELIEAHQKPVPQDRLTDYTDTAAGVYRIARHAFRILDLSKSLEANPQQANLFKERASEYSRLENYEQAIQDYNSCLALQPDDAGALHSRGQAYEQLGQSDRAMQDFQQATTSNPQLSDVYINRGIKFGEMGQFRQAIDNLSEGIRLAPMNPNGYFNRGATYLQLGDLEKAIEDFSMVIQLSSSDVDAYYWRGISHEEAGHQRQAIADYRQFLVLCKDPGAKEAIEQRLSQWEEAEPEDSGSQVVVRDKKQKTKQIQPEKPERTLDLYDLMLALGEHALQSTWFGSQADCDGEKAEELYAYTDKNAPIAGHDLLGITSGIRKTFEGDFQAFDPGESAPWIFIRAWEGNGFYIETNDPKTKKRLESHFQGVEEIEGATPPYQGIFIPN